MCYLVLWLKVFLAFASLLPLSIAKLITAQTKHSTNLHTSGCLLLIILFRETVLYSRTALSYHVTYYNPYFTKWHWTILIIHLSLPLLHKMLIKADIIFCIIKNWWIVMFHLPPEPDPYLCKIPHCQSQCVHQVSLLLGAPTWIFITSLFFSCLQKSLLAILKWVFSWFLLFPLTFNHLWVITSQILSSPCTVKWKYYLPTKRYFCQQARPYQSLLLVYSNDQENHLHGFHRPLL